MDNGQQGSNLEQIYCACWPFSLLNLCRIMKSVANVFLLSLHMFICMFLVQDLSEIVPELLSKLRVVEEKKPANNVSTNIMKIRELIAQARSVAKKVHQSIQINIQLDWSTCKTQHIQSVAFRISIKISLLKYIRLSTQTYQKSFWRVAQKSQKCIVLHLSCLGKA